MRTWAFLIGLVVLCGCGEEIERASLSAAPEPVQSADHRFSAELPAGWTMASESLTPTLSNPVEILAAGTAGNLRPGGDACAHVPVAALEGLGPDDAFVTVQERYGETDFPDRPERFSLTGRVEHGDAATCVRGEAELEEYWFEFRDAGRGFHVLVAFGTEVTETGRAEALALLDSLRFEPGPPGVHLDPDIARPFEDRAAGLSWQMPVPPWRRYDWPLTSAHGERLVLGTFDLERAPPDPNCTPRAAIEAMPPDGAFIYVFEYIDLAERWKRRIPQRAGELRLGPTIPYECMGESQMVTWQERGRAFQAHAYIGPGASATLRRDVESILSSIRVE